MEDEEVQYEEDVELTAALNTDEQNSKTETGNTDVSSVCSDENKIGESKVDNPLHNEKDIKNAEILNESISHDVPNSLHGDKVQTDTPSSKKRSRKQPASTIKRKKLKLDTQNIDASHENSLPDEETFGTPSIDQKAQKQPTSTSKRKKQKKSILDTSGIQETPVEVENLEASSGDLQSLYMNLPIKFEDDDADKPHKCSYCNRGFKKASNLKRHILTHTGERAFSCETCGKTFSTSHAVKLHNRQHTGDKPYQCEKCLKKFTYYANYKIHLRSHSDERPFTCLICGRSYTMSTTLKRHMLIHSENKPWKCDLCPKQFAQQLQLKSHMVSHSGLKPYACSICHKRFAQTYPLGKHMLKHAEEAYVDEIHPEAYNDGTVAALDKNNMADSDGVKKELETKKRDDMTEDIKDSVKETSNLSEGSATETEDVAKTPLRQSRCKVCNEVFVSLKQHMRVHMDQNPYYCTFCNREFLELTNLKQHLTTHTGDKPYACEECGREFAQASNLKSHMRIHTGERPFSCEICHKTFAHSSSMKNHVRFHTGEVCHYCTHCGKGFTDKSSLKKHVRTHTGEKPYICVHCGRGFAASSSLKTHMFTHGGARPYQCDQDGCVKQFARPSQLQKHLLNRHQIDRIVESIFDNEGGPTVNHGRNDLPKSVLGENGQKTVEFTGDPKDIPEPIDYTMSSKINDPKELEINKAMDNLNPLITQAIQEIDRKPTSQLSGDDTSQLSDNNTLPENVDIKKIERGMMLEQTAMPVFKGNI